MWAIRDFPDRSFITSAAQRSPRPFIHHLCCFWCCPGKHGPLQASKHHIPSRANRNRQRSWQWTRADRVWLLVGTQGWRFSTKELRSHSQPWVTRAQHRTNCAVWPLPAEPWQPGTSQKQKNHLFAVRLTWALPLPCYFLNFCFSLVFFFSDSLTASSIDHKESHSTGHISLDQRQKLPRFSPGWCCSAAVWEGVGKSTAGLCQVNQQQTQMLQKSQCSMIPSNHQEHAD